ncbi:MAG: hypothetical protein HY541_07550 [Deltaproteobacteria bacterium]|nr:hypothetical protein [Deltaproteobacteria bacterium]
MFHLHKISLIAVVDPEMRVIDYEQKLNAEGLTSGYRPVTGMQTPLSACLAERTANLFFLKYGGIEELCVGGAVVTPQGVAFPIKDYPRAATGCDLRRVVIGSRGLLGQFREGSLKVFPLPEALVWGLALFEGPEAALEGVRRMVGSFIRPLFVRIMEEKEGSGLLRSLNLSEEAKVVLAFKLGGLKGMVEAEREAVMKLNEADNVLFHWPVRPAEVEVLDQTLIVREPCLDFWTKYAPLAGRNPASPATDGEEALKKYLRENPC